MAEGDVLLEVFSVCIKHTFLDSLFHNLPTCCTSLVEHHFGETPLGVSPESLHGVKLRGVFGTIKKVNIVLESLCYIVKVVMKTQIISVQVQVSLEV